MRYDKFGKELKSSRYKNSLFSSVISQTDGEDFNKQLAIEYLHAFTSFASLSGLKFCKINYSCEIKKERGWKTIIDYLKIHSHLLKELISEKCDFNLINQLKLIDHLIAFEEGRKDIILTVNQLAVNAYTWFPWNTSDHQIYIEVWRKSSILYRVRIFNLGTGLILTDISTRTTYPQELLFDLPNLQVYFDILLQCKGAKIIEVQDHRIVYDKFTNKYLTEDDFYTAYVYAGSRVSCMNLCVEEYIQNTENCVVKNLLFLIRQDYIDRYGLIVGEQYYKEFYIQMLKKILSFAQTMAEELVLDFLRNSNELCDSILFSQNSFIGVGCHLLKDLLQESLADQEEGREQNKEQFLNSFYGIRFR